MTDAEINDRLDALEARVQAHEDHLAMMRARADEVMGSVAALVRDLREELKRIEERDDG